MINDTLAIVLTADLPGSLDVLTNARAKAAVPFGGEYRLIDFVLTNCMHSGVGRVVALAGTRSRSLQRHLIDGWMQMFQPQRGDYLQFSNVSEAALAGGSLAMLREQAAGIAESNASRVLLLRGDHVYRMDYAALLAEHSRTGAGASIVVADRSPGDVRRLGRLDLDGTRVLGWRDSVDAAEEHVCSPIGVHVFERDVLLRWLDAAPTAELTDTPALTSSLCQWGASPDGRAALGSGGLNAYRFGGETGRVSPDRYWSDVGGIDGYFDANMALLELVPPLDLYQDDWRVWSVPGKNPPARTVSGVSGNEGVFVNSIVSNGTVIVGAAISKSVLCPRVRVEDAATVEGCILFDHAVVEKGAALRRCIVEKNVRIGAGEQIGFDAAADRERFHVTEQGVVVVTHDPVAASAAA